MTPTLVMDLGGVLLSTAWTTAWTALERRLGLPGDEARALWLEGYATQLDTGAAAEADLWRDLAALRPATEPAAVRAVFLDEYRPIDRGIRCLKRGREAGWRTALATNHVGAWLDEWRRRYAWFGGFDVVCCSSDIGVAKPSDAFFEALVAMLGGPGGWFVDDQEANVRAAERHGFTPVLFDG